MAYQSLADSCQADVEWGGLAGDDAELRLILVGKSGGGKSTTGNTNLGRKESVVSAKTTTVRCQRGQGSWQGTTVYVVDTPAMFDTDDYTERMRREILACVNFSQPGPHALILVTQWDASLPKMQSPRSLSGISLGPNLPITPSSSSPAWRIWEGPPCRSTSTTPTTGTCRN